jgi:hypothetical protein
MCAPEVVVEQKTARGDGGCGRNAARMTELTAAAEAT